MTPLFQSTQIDRRIKNMATAASHTEKILFVGVIGEVLLSASLTFAGTLQVQFQKPSAMKWNIFFLLQLINISKIKSGCDNIQ